MEYSGGNQNAKATEVHVESSTWPSEAASTAKSMRVLVLEDDKSQWPLWESVVHDIDPKAEIDWNTSETNAEALIRHAFQTKNPYNIVICDVFLGEKDTGIDLWNRYGETASNFIFASVMNPAEFRELIEPKLTAKLGPPRFVQKPLTANLCKKAIQSLNQNPGGNHE